MSCPAHPHTHDLAEAAGMLGGTEHWLLKGCRRGKFPGRKITKQWRFTDGDIEAILESCRATTSPADDGPLRTTSYRRRHPA